MLADEYAARAIELLASGPGAISRSSMDDVLEIAVVMLAMLLAIWSAWELLPLGPSGKRLLRYGAPALAVEYWLSRSYDCGRVRRS